MQGAPQPIVRPIAESVVVEADGCPVLLLGVGTIPFIFELTGILIVATVDALLIFDSDDTFL